MIGERKLTKNIKAGRASLYTKGRKWIGKLRKIIYLSNYCFFEIVENEQTYRLILSGHFRQKIFSCVNLCDTAYRETNGHTAVSPLEIGLSFIL